MNVITKLSLGLLIGTSYVCTARTQPDPQRPASAATAKQYRTKEQAMPARPVRPEPRVNPNPFVQKWHQEHPHGTFAEFMEAMQKAGLSVE